MRQWRGRAAQRRALDLDENIDIQKTRLALASDKHRPAELQTLAKMYRQKGRAEKRAGSDYNVFQTTAGKALTTGLGVTGFLSGAKGKAVGGFAAGAKVKSEAAAKKAAEVGISERDAIERLREEKRGDKSYKLQRDAMQKEERNTAEIIETQKKTAQDLIQAGGLDEKHDAAKQNVGKAGKEALEVKEKAHRDYESGAISGERRDEILREGDSKIEQANTAVRELQARVDAINKPVREAEQAYEQARRGLEEFDNDVEKEIKSNAQKIATQSAKLAPSLAARLANPRWTDYLPQTIQDSMDNRVVARMARGSSKKKLRLKSRATQRNYETEEMRAAGLLENEGSSGSSGTS